MKCSYWNIIFGYLIKIILIFLGIIFKIQNNLNEKEITCVLDNKILYFHGNSIFLPLIIM